MMKSFMRKLSVERLRFYYSCEKLVSGLAKTSGEQEDLLQRPSARVWKTSLINGLEEKLKERLGDNLSAYTETIEQIATDLLELSDLLGIGQEKLVRCHGSQMGSCLGYIPNAEQKHYIHLVKPSSVIDRMIPLHDLLLDTGSTRPLKIRLKERYKMASVLASSLFQLCSTSWLDTKWSSRDIEVVKTQSDSKLGDHAFICTPFTSGTIPTDNPDISGYNSGLRKLAIKNEAIFALGIILLELSISTTLQSQQTDEDRKCHELADLKTAIRIAEQEADDNVQFWNAAVKKCLDCDFGEEPNFEKKAFREKFYEGVVAPLKNLYEMI
ncbi:hypothetical protein SLS56_011419 [Neofusicoccum ribis]|uniref:DUF7580 domain-containing protein n=1 Tax=Neofusicoccum ribis TaxID=45134 RepID=A0ABR3SBR0_9PEZI